MAQITQQVALTVQELVNEDKLSEIVRILRSLGQSQLDQVLIAKVPPFDETILHTACYKGSVDIVKFLLELGAEPFLSAGNQTATPLHSAAAGGNIQVVRLLLDAHTTNRHSHINKQMTSGFTALHCTLARYNLTIAKLLVFHGAGVDIPNMKGETCRKIYYELLEQEQTALPNIKNSVINIPGVSIQIASDLHLEFQSEKPIDYSSFIQPSAPILALLGDIGLPMSNSVYADFLYNMADKFQLVLVVAGNHEFYNTRGRKDTYEGVKAQIAKICDAHPRLMFLDKTSLLINNVRILGTTLWSYVPPNGKDICEMYLNDYRIIYTENEKDPENPHTLTASKSNEWFDDEITWLENEILQSMNRGEQSAVILTHHTPSFYRTSAKQYDTHPWKSHSSIESGPERRWTHCCFSSDLERLFAPTTNVKVWAFGHTHFNNDQTIGGTRLVSNQKGYSKGEERFQSNFVIHIS